MSSDINNNRMAKGLPGFLRRTIRSSNTSSDAAASTATNGSVAAIPPPPTLTKTHSPSTSESSPNHNQSHENKASFTAPAAISSHPEDIHPRTHHTVNTKTTAPPPTATTTKQDTQTHSKRSYKETMMDKVMSEQPVLNLSELKKLGWNGISPLHRPKAWKLLLGYLPTNVHRRTQTLQRKRNEYQDAVGQFYDINDNSRTFSEQETLRQVLVDVPRTAPDIPLFRRQEIRLLLSRLLYVWAMKHPASSYVQGINDLATPLVVVFLSEYAFLYYGMDFEETEKGGGMTENKVPQQQHEEHISSQWILDQVLDGSILDVLNKASTTSDTTMTLSHIQRDSSSSSSLHSQSSLEDSSSHDIYSLSVILTQVEADVYWCLTNLLSCIQDHYTSDQPGVQRMILRLEELVKRIDDPLVQHFQQIGVDFIQFAFKWMNCLLLREFTLPCVIRLWDTYFSEGEGGFEVFHVYVCAAFLCHFSADVRGMSFDEAFGFLQNLPTSKWTDGEIEILLSQAFVLSTLFHGSDAHLNSSNSHKTF